MKTISGLAAIGLTLLLAAPGAFAHPRPGAVYVLGNDAQANAVLVFSRARDGRLGAPVSYATGGLGSGAGLGSQGALALTPKGRLLFAVNAGSNDVSTFLVRPRGLVLIDRAASGGTTPISVAYQDGLVYVLNAGGTGNISGFYVTRWGLQPIPGAMRPLSSAAPGPAQIGFDPTGDQLVVTEKATNSIVTYALDDEGRAGMPQVHASAGQTPFGFAFATAFAGPFATSQLVVSEAFGGAADASALSTYDTGTLAVESASSPTHQTAACWVAVDGPYAYTTNAGSDDISGFRLRSDGQLSLLSADGRTGDTGAGSHPLDLDVGGGGHFLYALDSGTHEVSLFTVNADGSLTARGAVSGLPPAASGLVAR